MSLILFLLLFFSFNISIFAQSVTIDPSVSPVSPTNTIGATTPSSTPTSTPIPNLLTITSLPSSAVLGETFVVNFTLANSAVSTEYFVKVFGGVGESTFNIQTVNGSVFLNNNSDWDSFPRFFTDSIGNYSGTVTAKSKDNIGVYNFKLKLALSSDPSNTSKQINIVEPKTITIDSPPTATPTPSPTAIPPTNTPSVTPTPTTASNSAPASTNTPTKTPTPANSNTPTKTLTPTRTPTPNKTGTPTKTLTPTKTPTLPAKASATAGVTDFLFDDSILTPSPSPEPILGITDIIKPTPTPKPKFTFFKKLPPNFLPTLFIIVGGLLLLTPLIISKIKHE